MALGFELVQKLLILQNLNSRGAFFPIKKAALIYKNKHE
jgi:hypothetical protein